MIKKVFFIQTIIIHFILNAIIVKKNFMEDLYIIHYIMALKRKNIIIEVKKKIFGNIQLLKVISTLEILQVKGNL